MADKAIEDALMMYLGAPANVVDSPKPVDADLLKALSQYTTLPEAALVIGGKKKDARALANSDDESILGGIGKNIGTALIRGLSDIPGTVGNIGQFGDYLLSRGESAITGKSLEDVNARHANVLQQVKAAQTPIGTLANAINPMNVLPTGDKVASYPLAVTGAYEPQSVGANMLAGGIRAAAGSLGPGVMRAAPGVPGFVPQAVNVLAAQAPVAGALGAVGQGVADVTGDPLLGMAATLAPAGAAKLAATGRNALMGTVTPETAQLAATARNQYGIPVNAGQMAESKFARLLEDVSSRLPFSGGPRDTARQLTAFNRAVGETFGEPAATRITPEVMARARDRIGQDFETVAHNTRIIPDQQLVNDFAQAVRGTQLGATTAEPRIRNNIQEIASRIQRNGGVIDGRTYQDLTRTGGNRAGAGLITRLTQDTDPTIRDAGYALRNALDDALTRHAPADMRDLLTQARGQWKNLRTIEDIAAKAQDGNLSPALLQGRVNAKNKGTHGAAYGGGGDLAELGQIGQQFLKAPPNSMTADRSMIMSLLGTVGGMGTAMATGDLKNAAYIPAAVAGGILAGRTAGRTLRSDATTNALIARSLGLPTPATIANPLLRSALPANPNLLLPRPVQE